MAFKQLDTLIHQLNQMKNGSRMLLFRHGETLGNKTGQLAGWTDQKLSPKGREQSNALFQGLYKHRADFASIHTSDLIRARETCRIALGYSEEKVKIDSRLREINFGDLEGCYFNALDKKIQKELNQRDFQAPQGESWQDVADRTSKYFAQNCSQNGTHLVFSHGGLISTILHDMGLKEMNLPNCSAIAYNIDISTGNPSKFHWYWTFPVNEEWTI